MPLISPPQVQPGTEIKASDVNNPINDIAELLNGNLDQDNMKGGAVTADKLANGAVTVDKLGMSLLVGGKINPKIFQAGTSEHVPVDQSAGNNTLTFPTEFDNIPIVIACLGTGSTLTSLSCWVSSITKTDFNVNLRFQEFSGTAFIRWFAVDPMFLLG